MRTGILTPEMRVAGSGESSEKPALQQYTAAFTMAQPEGQASVSWVAGPGRATGVRFEYPSQPHVSHVTPPSLSGEQPIGQSSPVRPKPASPPPQSTAPERVTPQPDVWHNRTTSVATV